MLDFSNDLRTGLQLNYDQEQNDGFFQDFL